MYGLYEENEYPKRCKKCGSSASKIIQTWEAKNNSGETERRRKRQCRNCLRIYITFTRVEGKFILGKQKDRRFV